MENTGAELTAIWSTVITDIVNIMSNSYAVLGLNLLFAGFVISAIKKLFMTSKVFNKVEPVVEKKILYPDNPVNYNMFFDDDCSYSDDDCSYSDDDCSYSDDDCSYSDNDRFY